MIAAETPDSSIMPFSTELLRPSVCRYQTGGSPAHPRRLPKGCIVGDCVGNRTRNFGSVIDDLERRQNELRRAHDVIDTGARSFRVFTHYERQLDFRARLDEQIRINLRAIIVERIIQITP